MFKTKGFHTLELKWKAQKRERTKNDLSRITFEKIKKSTQPLEDFIEETSKNGAELSVDFIIDGTDLGFWLNLNYFGRRAIGTDYINSISAYFLNNDFSFYTKSIMTRILGQKINYEECLAFCRDWFDDFKDEEELIDFTKKYMNDENVDVVLYCSKCCHDKLCGYFGIQVYQTETSILWQLGLYRGGVTTFKFDKEDYFKAFKEPIELFNKESENLGLEPIDINKKGVMFKTLEERIDDLKKDYLINYETYTLEQLRNIFKLGKIEEIDTGIAMALQKGLNIEKLRADMETEYKGLSKDDKNSISWRIVDTSSAFNSVSFTDRTFAIKAYLLYNKQ